MVASAGAWDSFADPVEILRAKWKMFPFCPFLFRASGKSEPVQKGGISFGGCSCMRCGGVDTCGEGGGNDFVCGRAGGAVAVAGAG